MDSMIIPKNDYGYNLAFSVTESDETAKNLTDYTIKLKVWKPGIPGTLLLNGTCTLDDGEAGTCHYEIQDGDFDTAGRYYAELEITQEGTVESTESFIIIVMESG